MNKKIISIIMSAMMGITLLSGCGSSSESSVPKSSNKLEHADLKFVFYGDESKRMKEFSEGPLKEKIEKEFNASIEVIYLPWSEVNGGKSEMMLASGEDFATYTDANYISKCIAKGYAADLTDVAKKYAPDLYKNVNPGAFEAFSFQDKLYALPVGKKPDSGGWYTITIRQDLVEEAGFKEVKTWEDVYKIYEIEKKKHPELIGTADTSTRSYAQSLYTTENIEYVGGSSAYTDANSKDDKIYDFYLSPNFKKLCNITRGWKESGFSAPYVLSNPSQAETDWFAGKILLRAGNNGMPIEHIDNLKKSVSNAKLASYYINSNPKINYQVWNTAYIISANAKDPARYAMVINSMQQNQENYDFYAYGEKGKDYNIDSNGRVEKLTNDGFLDEWMLRNSKFIRFDKNVSDEFITKFKAWDNGSINAKGLGFTLNLDPIKSEAAKMDAVVAEKLSPIEKGFVEYDANIESALKAYKAAGAEKYLTELQKQFSAFRADKK